MPYKSEKIKISGTGYDRRVKLADWERNEIRRESTEEGRSRRYLAKKYGVSRRLIQFIINPEKYDRAREQFKERRKDGRYKASREEWAETMREHRRYKQRLYTGGQIEQSRRQNEQMADIFWPIFRYHWR